MLEGRSTRREFSRALLLMGLAGSAASASADKVLEENIHGRFEPARRVFDVTGGELMLEFLRDWNVPFVFGLGGSEEVGFLDALSDATNVKYVLALHEASAMADGYARSSGEIAFLNLHSVSGASYALGQMVNAFKDRTPLVVTVGRQSTDLRGSDAFLEAVNLHTLPGPYSHWNWDVLRSDSIPATLRRAFLTLVDKLINAQFPILVVGRAVSRYGGTKQLVALTELLGVAVMSDVPASCPPWKPCSPPGPARTISPAEY